MPSFINLIGKKFGKLRVISRDNRTDKFNNIYWLCNCNCGNRLKSINGSSLRMGQTTSCGCNRIKDLVGKRFGTLTVLEFSHLNKKNQSNWKCQCSCGKLKILKGTSLTQGKIASCGCKQYLLRNHSPHWTGYEEISGVFFRNIQYRAKVKGIFCDITIQQIWDLFLKQNKKCAYTNLELNFQSKRGVSDGNASLDRIDSSKGYTINNIQWIHKDINFMKQAFPENKFLEYCFLIVKNRPIQSLNKI